MYVYEYLHVCITHDVQDLVYICVTVTVTVTVTVLLLKATNKNSEDLIPSPPSKPYVEREHLEVHRLIEFVMQMLLSLS